jgi:hypothetical protein
LGFRIEAVSTALFAHSKWQNVARFKFCHGEAVTKVVHLRLDNVKPSYPYEKLN